jgi:hypothetical protein
MPRIVCSTTLAGEAERLARVSANDAIHDATPRSAVEGSNVRPDRRRSQDRIFHARRQDRGGECFAFNVADDASRSAKGKLNSDVEASDAGTE